MRPTGHTGRVPHDQPRRPPAVRGRPNPSGRAIALSRDIGDTRDQPVFRGPGHRPGSLRVLRRASCGRAPGAAVARSRRGGRRRAGPGSPTRSAPASVSRAWSRRTILPWVWGARSNRSTGGGPAAASPTVVDMAIPPSPATLPKTVQPSSGSGRRFRSRSRPPLPSAGRQWMKSD
jgi:hypothetical protein